MRSNANWHAFVKYKGLVWIVTVELSPEEERHLLNLSVIPAAAVTYLLLACFIITARNWQSLSLLQYLVYFGLPFVAAMPTTLFLSFEILYWRRTGIPLRHQAKRFFGRVAALFMVISSFVLILGIAYSALISTMTEWNILLVSGILWFIVWILLVFRARKMLDRLSRGQW